MIGKSTCCSIYDNFQTITVDNIGAIRSELNSLVDEGLNATTKIEADELHARAMEVIMKNITVK